MSRTIGVQTPYFSKHWPKVIRSLDLLKKRLLLFLMACLHDPGIDAAGSTAYIYHGHKIILKVQSGAIK